jgi:hypothetical protein
MFSGELIELLKAKKGFTKDGELVGVLPAVSKGIVSELKSGKRQLTEEQALFIAHECDLCVDWVFVCIAEEKAKSEEAKYIWHNLAKKIKKSASAAILALIVVFGGLDSKQPDSAVFG